MLGEVEQHLSPLSSLIVSLRKLLVEIPFYDFRIVIR